jgi:hypothetical protein
MGADIIKTKINLLSEGIHYDSLSLPSYKRNVMYVKAQWDKTEMENLTVRVGPLQIKVHETARSILNVEFTIASLARHMRTY